MIGLGNMGLPMAKNMVAAGLHVTATSRSNSVVDDARSFGMQIVDSIAEVAKSCDVIVTMLPADREVISVYEDEGGIIDNCKQGAVCIDMTSAKGETMRRIRDTGLARAKDIKWLDAPVSGGVAAAATAMLTIMVSGERMVFDEYLPFFEIVGKKITYTGLLGSAKDVKMLNQALNAGNSCVAAEVMMLAKQLDVDLDVFMDVVNESSGGSWIFKNNVPRYITHDHKPGFKLDLMKKDVSLFTEVARMNGDFTPIIDMVINILSAAGNQGHGEQNYTYISKWIEEQNNLH